MNGGIPGIIYGLLVAGFYYTFIGLSLSELASSLPSSGGVYHWATMVAGPRKGRVVGFFTGWINFFAWMFGLASLVQVTANTVVQMYATYHSAFVSEAWSVYIAYLGVLWVSVACVVFANWFVPHTQNLGMALVLAGGLATIVTLAAMPKKHASNHFVWGSFNANNETGWGGGVAFMTGVLNGAFTIGTPDSITHMAEEVKAPRRNLPKGIMLQISLGTLSAFLFAIVLGYSINDISVLQGGVNTFPLAAIYHQATDSAGATFGLLFIIFLSLMCGVVGTVLTATRTFWALARDNAVPLAHVFSRVNETLSCPVEATVFVGLVVTGLGAIPIGSSVGFTNLTGSFIILNSISYAIPFMANVMTGRKNFQPGPFYLGKYGYAVNITAVLCITLFNIFFCFRTSSPISQLPHYTANTHSRCPSIRWHNHELQLCHHCRHCHYHRRVVVYPRCAPLQGPAAAGRVCPRHIDVDVVFTRPVYSWAEFNLPCVLSSHAMVSSVVQSKRFYCINYPPSALPQHRRRWPAR